MSASPKRLYAALTLVLALSTLGLWSASSSAFPARHGSLPFPSIAAAVPKHHAAPEPSEPEPSEPSREKPSAEDPFNEGPADSNDKAEKDGTKNEEVVLALQLLFSVFFYCIVVRKYPHVTGSNDSSATIANTGECDQCCKSCCGTNWWLSFCCFHARQALNFHATRTCSYWPAFCCSLCFPNCLTFYGSSCTDMQTKLGGESENCCKSLICACCCVWCVVLKRAESIDAATGVKTGCCSVVQGREGNMKDPLLSVAP